MTTIDEQVDLLDAALCRGDNLNDLSNANPSVAFRDQVQAAAAHAGSVAQSNARARGLRVRDGIPHADTPAWLRRGMLRAIVVWMGRIGETCPHAADRSNVQPISLAAWNPMRATCLACTATLAVEHGSVADRTCDGCGTVTDGRAGMYPGTMIFGPFTYFYGTCADCRVTGG